MAFKTTMKSVDDITPYEDNARINDKAVEKVAQSILNYGWQSPIVVDEDMIILAGHSRLKAAKLLDIKKVPVKVAEDLTDEQKMAYRLMDNKSQDYAQWDKKLLAKEFDKLADLDFDLNMTGFDLDEIAKLNESMLEFDAPTDVDIGDMSIDASFDVPETNVKQFMLLLQQLSEFKSYLLLLKDKYGIDNFSDIVFRAVKNESDT